MTSELINLLLIVAGVFVVVLIGFVAIRTRSKPRDYPPPPPEVTVDEADKRADEEFFSGAITPDVVIPEVPKEVQDEVVLEEPVIERASLAERLSKGLRKSRQAFGGRIASIIGRDKLDDEAWEEIEEALIRADIGVKVTTKIISQLQTDSPKPEELQEALRRQLVSALDRKDRDLQIVAGSTNVWLVTGVNGVGKTTSIAKLARQLSIEGKSVVLAAADTYRAAAIDQLAIWAERAGVHMIKHKEGADPGAVVFDAIQYAKARGVEVVIVDTAGRLHTKMNLMEELKKIRRIADRESGIVSEVLLVLDSTVGQNGISQARTFQEAVDITGVILTKLDGTARGGIAVAVQQELGIPIKAIGVGETIDDLQPFVPETFIDALLGDN